jgi:hypothetical protein
MLSSTTYSSTMFSLWGVFLSPMSQPSLHISILSIQTRRTIRPGDSMPPSSLSLFSLDFKWFYPCCIALTKDKYRRGPHQEWNGDIVRCDGGGSSSVLRKLSGSLSSHRSDLSTTYPCCAEGRCINGSVYQLAYYGNWDTNNA